MRKEKLQKLLDGIAETSILVTLFVLPFSKTILEISVTAAICAYFLRVFLFGGAWEAVTGRKVYLFVAFYVIFNVLSLINSESLSKSLIALVSKVVKWGLFYTAVAGTFTSEERLKKAFRVLIAISALVCLDAVVQLLTGADFLHYPPYKVFKWHDMKTNSMVFPTASFPFPNDFASWINAVIFIFLCLLMFDLKEKPLRRISLAVFAALMYFLVLTSANAALAGTAVALFLFAMLNVKKNVIPLVAIGGFMISLFAFLPSLREYFMDFLNLSGSIEDRTDMWSVGVKIFRQHPFIGNGVNTFFDLFREFRTDGDRFLRGSYAHNCYLQMASDTGILGLLSFLGFVCAAFFSDIRACLNGIDSFTGAFVAGVSLGMVAFLVNAFFDTNLYSLNLVAMFWSMMGLIEGGKRALAGERMKMGKT